MMVPLRDAMVTATIMILPDATPAHERSARVKQGPMMGYNNTRRSHWRWRDRAHGAQDGMRMT
jgi:hypothetical protein